MTAREKEAARLMGEVPAWVKRWLAMEEAGEVRPIGYRECSDALLKLWMDDIITDGEYNRIMYRLNKAHREEVKRNV